MSDEEIFAEDEIGAWHQTETSEPLCSDVDGSLRDVVRCGWQDVMWQAYMALPETVQTGKTSFDITYGEPFFEYLHHGAAIPKRYSPASTPYFRDCCNYL